MGEKGLEGGGYCWGGGICDCAGRRRGFGGRGGRGEGGADGGEDVAGGESADVAVDDDDGVSWVLGGEVGGEVVQKAALGAVAIEAGTEALGELKRPLREGLGVEGLEEVDVRGVRVFELAEDGEVFVVTEEVQGGEVVG